MNIKTTLRSLCAACMLFAVMSMVMPPGVYAKGWAGIVFGDGGSAGMIAGDGGSTIVSPVKDDILVFLGEERSVISPDHSSGMKMDFAAIGIEKDHGFAPAYHPIVMSGGEVTASYSKPVREYDI